MNHTTVELDRIEAELAAQNQRLGELRDAAASLGEQTLAVAEDELQLIASVCAKRITPTESRSAIRC